MQLVSMIFSFMAMAILIGSRGTHAKLIDDELKRAYNFVEDDAEQPYTTVYWTATGSPVTSTHLYHNTVTSDFEHTFESTHTSSDEIVYIFPTKPFKRTTSTAGTSSSSSTTSTTPTSQTPASISRSSVSSIPLSTISSSIGVATPSLTPSLIPSSRSSSILTTQPSNSGPLMFTASSLTNSVSRNHVTRISHSTPSSPTPKATSVQSSAQRFSSSVLARPSSSESFGGLSSVTPISSSPEVEHSSAKLSTVVSVLLTSNSASTSTTGVLSRSSTITTSCSNPISSSHLSFGSIVPSSLIGSSQSTPSSLFTSLVPTGTRSSFSVVSLNSKVASETSKTIPEPTPSSLSTNLVPTGTRSSFSVVSLNSNVASETSTKIARRSSSHKSLVPHPSFVTKAILSLPSSSLSDVQSSNQESLKSASETTKLTYHSSVGPYQPQSTHSNTVVLPSTAHFVNATVTSCPLSSSFASTLLETYSSTTKSTLDTILMETSKVSASGMTNTIIETVTTALPVTRIKSETGLISSQFILPPTTAHPTTSDVARNTATPNLSMFSGQPHSTEPKLRVSGNSLSSDSVGIQSPRSTSLVSALPTPLVNFGIRNHPSVLAVSVSLLIIFV